MSPASRPYDDDRDSTGRPQKKLWEWIKVGAVLVVFGWSAKTYVDSIEKDILLQVQLVSNKSDSLAVKVDAISASVTALKTFGWKSYEQKDWANKLQWDNRSIPVVNGAVQLSVPPVTVANQVEGAKSADSTN